MINFYQSTKQYLLCLLLTIWNYVIKWLQLVNLDLCFIEATKINIPNLIKI